MQTGRAFLFRAATAIVLLAVAPDQSAQAEDRVVYTVAPNEADPGVRRFLRSSIVLFDRTAPPQAPLLVFLPGTGGDAARVRLFLGVAADAGYRVIALSYDNEPAVMQVCARDSNPACVENFRQSRVFGGAGAAPADTPPDEAIVTRLTRLLQFLDGRHPEEGWRSYLANGVPDWRRIALAGHSQGGGMAAFLAKRAAVARVALLAGPPDFVPPGRQPAPWLAVAGATPPDRWYGLYHRDEPLAPLLRQAYAALGLAADHIRVVGLAPAAALGAGFFDSYHVSIVADRLTPRAADASPAYAADWVFLLGRGR
jgi:acetyl esterase/lipase